MSRTAGTQAERRAARRTWLVVLVSVVVTLLVAGRGTAAAVVATRVFVTNGQDHPVPVTTARAPHEFQQLATLGGIQTFSDVAGRAFAATDLAMISSITASNPSAGMLGVRIGSALLGSHASCSDLAISDFATFQPLVHLYVPARDTRQLTFPQPLLVFRKSQFCLVAWDDTDNTSTRLMVTVVGSVS